MKSGFYNGLVSREVKSLKESTKTDWHLGGCASCTLPCSLWWWWLLDATPLSQPAAKGFASTWYLLCAGVNDFTAQTSITSQPPAEPGVTEMFTSMQITSTSRADLCIFFFKSSSCSAVSTKSFSQAASLSCTLATQHSPIQNPWCWESWGWEQIPSSSRLWPDVPGAEEGGVLHAALGQSVVVGCSGQGAAVCHWGLEEEPSCATSTPGVLHEALEDWEVGTGKMRSILPPAHGPVSRWCPFPPTQQHPGPCQPQKHAVHPSRGRLLRVPV